MYFQTAGIEVAPWLPPLVAFSISFFTSMGGVSGAILLLPFQMSFLGFTNPSVSSTNQLYNVLAIPSGVYRYIKEGRMVWPLAWIVVMGTLPGVLIGAIVRVTYLPDPKHFKLFAAFVLTFVGLRVLGDLAGSKDRDADKASSERRFHELVQQYLEKRVDGQQLPAVHVTEMGLRRIRYEFYGEQFHIPSWGVAFLGFAVGIVGGIYGVGGGAMIAPFLVSFFKLPVYTVAGAALMGTLVTSVAGVGVYQAMAPVYPHRSVAPDWLLGFLFGLGGMCGMYLGARCQKWVPAIAIKWILSGVILYTAGRYAADFF
jgi:uncharacterized membrane protein YfcA